MYVEFGGGESCSGGGAELVMEKVTGDGRG